MVSKKGEGVRGVLGDLVSRDRERREPPPPAAAIAEPLPPAPEPVAEASPMVAAPAAIEAATPAEPAERTPKKVPGIKGRPRNKKDQVTAPIGERTKCTLSIDATLKDQFYLLAHGEMMQPGEFVERALRYYIKHHPRKA